MRTHKDTKAQRKAASRIVTNGSRLFARTLFALFACVVIAAAEQPGDRIDRVIAEADRLAADDVRRADLALPLYQEAIRLAGRAGDIPRLSQAWIKLANAYWDLGRNQDALLALEQARTLVRAGGDAAVEGVALRLLGTILIDRGEYGDAERAFKESQTVARRLGDIEMEARAFNSLSVNARHQGRLPEAVDYARLGLSKVDAALAAGMTLEPRTLFALPFNVGKGLSDSGDYGSAIVYLDRAFTTAERLRLVGGLWHALHDTAEWYRAQGDLDRAARYFERALAQSRSETSRLDEAQTLLGLGAVDQTRGELAKAIERFSTALTLYERAGILSEVPLTLAALARAYFLSGQHRLAATSIQRALRLAVAQNKPNAAALSYLELGRQEQALGRMENAAASYEQAVRIARESGLRPLVPPALAGLAQVAHVSGNLEEAVRRYRASADAIAAIRGHILSIDQRAAFADAAHATYAGLFDALMELHRRNGNGEEDREALLALERERTQSLTEALAQASVDRWREAPPELRDRQRQLARLVAELQIQLQAPEISASRRKTLLARLDDAERALDAFEGELGRKAAAGSAGDFPGRLWAAPSNLVSLQRSLQPNEAIVEYSDGAGVAFVVTRDGFRSVVLLALDRLADRIDLFNSLLMGPAPEGALPAGRLLARAIVEPVLAILPPATQRLLIAASGSLAGLSFATLPDPAETANRRDAPLLKRFEVSYVPSLAALAHLRITGARASPRDLLAIGNPRRRVTAPDEVMAARLRGAVLAPLPYSAREVDAIARSMSGPVELLTDDSATEAKFKASPLGEFKLLHFATHAILDSEVPSRSAIVLADGDGGEDGFLQPREIYSLDLAADLVVLSACRSASGRASSAEGMQSLSRAFMYAGARAVVGTLWDVDDRETAQLMEPFYAALTDDGMSAGAALREAQLRVAGVRPYARPMGWGAFVVAGDPLADPAIAPVSLGVRLRRAQLLWGIAGTLFVLALAGLAMARRWKKNT